jgi:hypothetical protein
MLAYARGPPRRRPRSFVRDEVQIAFDGQAEPTADSTQFDQAYIASSGSPMPTSQRPKARSSSGFSSVRCQVHLGVRREEFDDGYETYVPDPLRKGFASHAKRLFGKDIPRGTPFVPLPWKHSHHDNGRSHDAT